VPVGDHVRVAQSESCPFCARITPGEVERRHGSAVALADAFPVSRGHTLVLPTTHETCLFALSPEEQTDIWELVANVRAGLLDRLAPRGFNIGVNDGAAAGQTVDHAHVHVIPRFAGDVGDPRGGVRWVLPEKAAYWDG
jgi:diadenosine tetraphosphate (Ap4A) HIT family hydrolase